jgi:peptide/nickel transport system ATP-binding protein/peptide/nickel transport system permease protein
MSGQAIAQGPSRAQTSPDDPIVRVEHLSVWFPRHYGDIPVLDDISFTLGRGETLGLVGESGSGKTLLSQAILGLLPPSAKVVGRIVVAGTDVVGAREKELNAIRGAVAAPVFQDALVSLNPNRTVFGHFKDVWRSARMQPRDGARVAASEALRLAALPDVTRVLGSYPHELSGGMRQRALIALALFRGPSLLIADEPTTALDRVVEVEVLATLRRLQAELGLSMVLVSHDMEVVSHMCARIAVLYGGQLCELGPTPSVVTGQVHPYTAGLLASVRSLEEVARPLRSIPGVVPHPSNFNAGCRFLPRCPEGGPECLQPRPAVVVGAVEAWCHHPLGSPGRTATWEPGGPEAGP